MDNTKIRKLHELLYAHYGEMHWWPADTPYEVMVGAVLTQNTAWSNVKKALAGFGARLDPSFVETASLDEIRDIIRPAGFFNQKSVYLKTLTEWFSGYDCSCDLIKTRPPEQIRKELLALCGIGAETADSIMLYAFGFPIFVVDNYTLRLTQRLYAAENRLSYNEAQRLYMSALDKSYYNNCHAMIVEVSKDYCRSKALCDNCPLRGVCSTGTPGAEKRPAI